MEKRPIGSNKSETSNNEYVKVVVCQSEGLVKVPKVDSRNRNTACHFHALQCRSALVQILAENLSLVKADESRTLHPVYNHHYL